MASKRRGTLDKTVGLCDVKRAANETRVTQILIPRQTTSQKLAKHKTKQTFKKKRKS